MNIICKASLKTILGIMVLWSFVSSAIATNDTTHNWKLVITNEDGSKLGGANGPKIPKLVVNKKYKVKGQLPAELLNKLKDKYLVIEHQSADETGEDTWKVIGHIPPTGSTGKFEKTFTADKHLAGPRHFRISEFRASEGPDAKATSTVIGSSEILGTSVVLEFYMNITNDAKSDLTLSIPTSYNSTADNYNIATFDLLQGQTANLTYQGPTDKSIFHITANRVGKNTIYNSKWDYSQGPNYTKCSDAPPPMNSGDTYNVRITPQAWSSGFDMYIDGTNFAECEAELATDFLANFQDNTGQFIFTTLATGAEIAGMTMLIAGACDATAGLGCLAAIGLIVGGGNYLYHLETQ